MIDFLRYDKSLYDDTQHGIWGMSYCCINDKLRTDNSYWSLQRDLFYYFSPWNPRLGCETKKKDPFTPFTSDHLGTIHSHGVLVSPRVICRMMMSSSTQPVPVIQVVSLTMSSPVRSKSETVIDSFLLYFCTHTSTSIIQRSYSCLMCEMCDDKQSGRDRIFRTVPCTF